MESIVAAINIGIVTLAGVVLSNSKSQDVMEVKATPTPHVLFFRYMSWDTLAKEAVTCGVTACCVFVRAGSPHVRMGNCARDAGGFSS